MLEVQSNLKLFWNSLWKIQKDKSRLHSMLKIWNLISLKKSGFKEWMDKSISKQPILDTGSIWYILTCPLRKKFHKQKKGLFESI